MDEVGGDGGGDVGFAVRQGARWRRMKDRGRDGGGGVGGGLDGCEMSTRGRGAMYSRKNRLVLNSLSYGFLSFPFWDAHTSRGVKSGSIDMENILLRCKAALPGGWFVDFRASS